MLEINGTLFKDENAYLANTKLDHVKNIKYSKRNFNNKIISHISQFKQQVVDKLEKSIIHRE